MAVNKEHRLTPADKRALKAFRAAKKKAGVWPSLDEVARELEATTQAAEYFLKRLVAAGKLVKESRYRGYREVARAARTRTA